MILSPRGKARKGNSGFREALMTEASPVVSTALLRQIDQLGVLCVLARSIIIVQPPPVAEEPGFLIVL